MIERAEKAMRRRPCLCFCSRAHPADHGICEVFDAVITGQYSSDLLGDFDVPLCARAPRPGPRATSRASRTYGEAPVTARRPLRRGARTARRPLRRGARYGEAPVKERRPPPSPGRLEG